MGTIRRLVLDIFLVLLMAVIIGAGAAYLKDRFYPKPSPATQTVTQFTPAPEIKTVEKIKTVMVPGPTQVVTVDKPVIVEKLKLPDEIKNNPDEQVVSTAVVQPYEWKTDAIAIMNTKTGESEIQIKQEPVPFFEFKNEKEVGITGYFRADLQGIHPEGRIDAGWTFMRTGQLRWQLWGEGNTRPEAKGGLRVYVRW
jgi:hypothetical protein